MKSMTAMQLIVKLMKVKNPNAVVVLCEEDREYTPFVRVIDESQYPDKEGVIGNVLLTIK